MISWLSIEINHPPMDEGIIVQKDSGVTELVILPSKDASIDWFVEHLTERKFTRWSDVK